jgi:hypothetical protein
MGIVLVVFAAGIQQIYGAEERTETAADTQSQILQAFQRLDKGVRYASSISLQGTVGSDPYVEYLSSYTGTPTCTELRLHVATHELQQRSWTQNMSPLVPGAWIPLASEISSTTFTKVYANATFNFQRLQIQLASTAGTNSNQATRASNITFTALNTSLNMVNSDTVCTEGRAVA